jgi:hypothetical protein
MWTDSRQKIYVPRALCTKKAFKAGIYNYDIYRMFQKGLHYFERVYKVIQRTYKTF